MITKREQEEGFNDKCEDCECYHCVVDYVKLVCAPSAYSTLCKYGIGLKCDTCRKTGDNSAFQSIYEETQEKCDWFCGTEE